jgi:hypothetical protein
LLGFSELVNRLVILSNNPIATIGVTVCQLALTLLVISQFELENRTFFNVMLLAAAGFVVHALLPLKYRLAFFAVLSLASIMLVLGPVDGPWLIALGLVLIAVCRCRLHFLLKVGVLTGLGALFAGWRMELFPAPWSAAIWPILASLFMFRLALYLHSLRHEKLRPGIAQSLSYFFMLPNVCFPLYPVIDYATFVHTYFDRDAWTIYATGMRWIVRGLVHLILYRFVYLHLVNDPSQLQSLGDVVRFLLATFLLYLRVSGQFHLCVGILHLYGFRLPETHHLYFLAESFSDFWRRINIYWKDFMMKLVYYPSYFWLRRRGNTIALVGATVTVFVVTWLLHSYQWFWLRGGFPVEAQDAVFWGALGTLVVFGSLREMRGNRQSRPRRSRDWSLSLGLRRIGTFAVICILWSLWSAESLGGWLTMWTAAGHVIPSDLILIAALLLGGLLIAGWPWSLREAEDNRSRPWQAALRTTAVLLGVITLGHTQLYSRQAPLLASAVASLQHSTLNARDAALQHRGYYEKLDNASRMSAQLWEVQARRPSHWVALGSTEAYRNRNDFLRGELRPGVHIMFEDQPLSTNEWGMRDRRRLQQKPEGTYRIAVLGPSHVMGSGVADRQTFVDFLEERLNKWSDSGSRYEVLNFGVAGYSLVQQLALLEQRVVKFEPDAVFIIDSQGLKPPVIEHLVSVLRSGAAIPYLELDALVRSQGVGSVANAGIPVPFESVRNLLGYFGIETRMLGREAAGRLRPAADLIVRWTLRQIGAVAREHEAVPVFVALNNVREPNNEVRALKEARTAGFLVFDLLNLWTHQDKPALRVAEWDEHPNPMGNRLIADRIFQLMQEQRSVLKLGRAVRVAMQGEGTAAAVQ